jgi:hypothetical protein
MADAAETPVTTEFVFRRLSDNFPLSSPESSPGLYWLAVLGLLILATLSFVPILLPARKTKGSSLLAALGATVMTLLTGKVDDSKPGLWQWATSITRSLLFLWPAFFLLITKNFEAENETVWWIFTVGMLIFAALLTVLMYIRDARTVGFWAAPLALMRITVLCILAFCFLLPAYQTWEESTKTSRVVVVLDISPSMKTSDEASLDPKAVLKTRIDKVLDVLTDDQNALLARLLEKNPILMYRFASRLDDEPVTLTKDTHPKGYSKPEWEKFLSGDLKPAILKGLSTDAIAKLQNATAWTAEPGTEDWFLGWSKAANADRGFAGLTDDDKRVVEANTKRVENRMKNLSGLTQGTAVADSLTAVVNRESSNMTQGIVVFSDGRSNIGSESAFVQLAKRAKEANIPIVTVAVGEAREIVSLTLSDLQVPDKAMPDEPAQISVGVDGVGFKEGEEVELILELFLPGRDPRKDVPDHEMRKAVKFSGGEPPHGETTFTLDAEKFGSTDKEAFVGENLPRALVDDAPASKVGRKYMLKQGAWNVRAKVAKNPKELFREPYHYTEVRPMQVIDKPLRVLIVSSGPTREYQTLRSLLVRETDQKRAEVSIYLQNEGGQDGTIVQDVEPGRLLLKFPDELEAGRKPGAGGEVTDATALSRQRYNNLDEYDIVVVFDPNWNERDKSNALRIPNTAFTNLEKFVTKFGGGFVYVAGGFYTPQLARNDEESGRLRPILNILPVIPDDAVVTEDVLLKLRLPKFPRRLKLNPKTEADLLRLDDETTLTEPDRATAGWEKFFTGREKFVPSQVPGEDLNPKQGMFTYYPVKGAKPGVTPLAEFMNVDERGQAALRPFYAVTQAEVGRTAWIGSGEIYRLRAVDPTYYDRFWLKLLRFAGGKRNTGSKARGQVLMSDKFIAGGPIRVQARVLQANGDPYLENDLDKPKFTIKQYDENNTLVKEHGPFDVLKPTKLGPKFEGYYKGTINADTRKFPVDAKYELVVSKGDLPEPLKAKFTLKASNPEMDNLKPDFVAMTTAATGLKDVLDRIADPAVRQTVSATLGGNNRAADEAKAKLAIRLNETEKLKVIPECIRNETRKQRDRGLVDDIWDDETTPAGTPLSNWLRTELVSGLPYIRLWAPVLVVMLLGVVMVWILRSRATNNTLGVIYTLLLLALITACAAVLYFGNPFPVGIAVLAITALLGLEWTTRKLIRLA